MSCGCSHVLCPATLSKWHYATLSGSNKNCSYLNYPETSGMAGRSYALKDQQEAPQGVWLAPCVAFCHSCFFFFCYVSLLCKFHLALRQEGNVSMQSRKRSCIDRDKLRSSRQLIRRPGRVNIPPLQNPEIKWPPVKARSHVFQRTAQPKLQTKIACYLYFQHV